MYFAYPGVVRVHDGDRHACRVRGRAPGGVPVASANGVTVTGMQDSCPQVQVGSGTYRFRSTVS
jgi:hypothetical protein